MLTAERCTQSRLLHEDRFTRLQTAVHGAQGKERRPLRLSHTGQVADVHALVGPVRLK